jgi:hypothetical protein
MMSSVTASSNELTAPIRGLLATVRAAMPRNEFFAGLYILGWANGLGGSIIQSFSAGDWTGNTQNISVIALFAAFAGISLLLRDKSDKIRAADLAIAVPFLVCIALPVREMNWAAVTGLSFYILLFANDNSSRRRGAVILAALTVPMLWSRLLFAFCAKIFLEFDASLVSHVLGTHRTGNIVGMADGTGQMVILPACSSLANVSLAFLCWVSVSEWVEHPWSPKDILWCLLACATVIAINVTRIAVMGLGQWYFMTFHYGWGATLVNAVILCLTVGITVLGVRRELFSHP